jgi:hypothetical protein
MENLRQASISLPSSVDSSFAFTPLLSESSVGEGTGEGLNFCLPASLDIESNDNNFSTISKDYLSTDVAMAAAVALRAQQQQATSAAAAAQAALTRILQTAAAHGVAVQPQPQQSQYSSLLPPLYPSISTSAVLQSQGFEQQGNGEELALQQLMSGLDL